MTVANAVTHMSATISHYVLAQEAALVSANQIPLDKVAAAAQITTTLVSHNSFVVLTLIAMEVKVFA